jgi:hypothetical protein
MDNTMTIEQQLVALAADPAGIQVTLYPNRCTIDLGYGDHLRFEAATLKQAVQSAYEVGLTMGTCRPLIPGPGSPSIPTCRDCAHWQDWASFYEDSEEPDDLGYCWHRDQVSNKLTAEEPLFGDDPACPNYTPADWLPDASIQN